MLVLASGDFAIAEVAKSFPDSPLWQFLGYEFEHVPWTGCSFWDLIQPSFMFMVGAAIPYSHASRVAKGQSSFRMAAHVLYRSVVLILLGVFLASSSSSFTRTHFIFTNAPAQFGLGYAFVYLLVNRSFAFQLLIVLVILAGYWYVFFNQPIQSRGQAFLTSTERDRELWWFPGSKDTPPSLYAHWNKNANFAAEFDQWFLNLFPQQPRKSFRFDEGGYQTLNFIPSMATMIFGLMAGGLCAACKPGEEVSHPLRGRRPLLGDWLGPELHRLSQCEAHLDAELGHLQLRLDVLDVGRLLPDYRCSRFPPLGISFGGGRHELHGDVPHVAALEAVDPADVDQAHRPGAV